MRISEYQLETLAHQKSIAEKLNALAKSLIDRGEHHDEAKFTPEELPLLASEDPRSVDIAMQHHYRLTRHHPQHFKNGMRDMCLIDLVETFVDWEMDAEEEGKDFSEILAEKQKEFGFSDDIRDIMQNTYDQSKQD